MLNNYIINGKIFSGEAAKIHVSDLALLRAYGVFDYFRFVNGKPVFMEDHLQRFQHSAKLMNLEFPFSKKELIKLIFDLAKANEVTDAGIHMILTGGFSKDAFTPSKPNLILMASPFTPQPKIYFENGVKLLLWKYQRELPEVKTINYIIPILAQKKKEAAGALDILYHDGKFISECSRCNLFMVADDNKLITPKKGILKGITRKHTLELARNFFDVELRDISIDELKCAREVFITSSSKRIVPVAQIDDFTIGNGKPGAVTIQLAELLQLQIGNLHGKVVY